MPADLLSVVESAYRLDESDDVWLQGIADAAAKVLNRGPGIVTGCIHGERGQAPRLLHAAVAGAHEGIRQTMVHSFGTVPDERKARAIAVLPCATSSEALGEGDAFLQDPTARQYLQPYGIFDVLWITVPDPGGHCLAMGIALPEIGRTSPSVRTRYARLGAHLTSAFRLRRRLLGFGTERPTGEATLRPDGRVDDAHGEATTPLALSALRAAAVALDRARGPERSRDIHKALASWQSLVAAQWSLVDKFDSDGRRYLIAHRNEASQEGMLDLSARESAVAGFAALGHSNKFIAYELGLSPSTVAVYLKRVARKLRVNSRVALIERWAKGKIV